MVSSPIIVKTPKDRRIRDCCSALCAAFSTKGNRCYFDYMDRRHWKQFPDLGSVLNVQLVYQGKATRSTQTNWKWRKMAERWRHAKIMESLRVPDDYDLLTNLSKELAELRKVRPIDKCTDTEDLEYDPFEVNTQLTQRSSFYQQKYLPPRTAEILARCAKKWKTYIDFKRAQTSRKLNSKSVDSGNNEAKPSRPSHVRISHAMTPQGSQILSEGK